jgi:hypothetical protein
MNLAPARGPLALSLMAAFAILLFGHRAYAAIDWTDTTASAANPGADLGSASYSTWSLQGNRVIVRFLLPAPDAERITGSDIEVVVQQRMGGYLLDHLAVRAAGAPCPAADQGFDIGRVDPLTVSAGLYGFEIFFQCGQSGIEAQASGVTLEDHALFAQLPRQVNFAQIQIGAGALQAQLFTPTHQQLRLPVKGAVSPAPLSRYLGLGLTRIFNRWDSLCFLLGSVLLVRRPRDGLLVLYGLATGLVLSLPAVLMADLVPRGQLAGSAVGLLIALLAGQLLSGGLARPRPVVIGAVGALCWLAALAWLAHGRGAVLLLAGGGLLAGGVLGLAPTARSHAWRCVLLPAAFAFLAGLVLASALAPLQFSVRERLPMVLAFDVGALLGAAAWLVLGLLGREALSRWHGSAAFERLRALTLDGTVAALGGLGVFWMLSRLHG